MKSDSFSLLLALDLIIVSYSNMHGHENGLLTQIHILGDSLSEVFQYVPKFYFRHHEPEIKQQTPLHMLGS